MGREKILIQIDMERHRQNIKWGTQSHNPVEWMAILTEEVGEAAKEAVDFHFTNPAPYGDNRSPRIIKNMRMSNFRNELLQVAAVAVSIMEDMDKKYLT